MEIKFRLLLAIFFIILFSQKLYSEEKQDEISLKDTEVSAEEKWQYLEWEEENPEFVLNYEVIIEALDETNGIYTQINRLQTETNNTYIQVKPFLPPGNYRYKVITYNLIGIAVVES